jgi:hypothetical protein
VKPESGSSYRWGTPPTGESVPQIDAAALTQLKKSVAGGRSVRWDCQLSSSSFQILSEMPSSSAFAGLEGFPPPTTLNTTSDEESSQNGSFPVSTYTRGFSLRLCVGHRVVRTWYVAIAIAYMSASLEGVHLSSPNIEGTRSSGAMKGVDPPPGSE